MVWCDFPEARSAVTLRNWHLPVSAELFSQAPCPVSCIFFHLWTQQEFYYICQSLVLLLILGEDRFYVLTIMNHTLQDLLSELPRGISGKLFFSLVQTQSMNSITVANPWAFLLDIVSISKTLCRLLFWYLLIHYLETPGAEQSFSSLSFKGNDYYSIFSTDHSLLRIMNLFFIL